MTATAETVRKLNSLKEQDFTIVINLDRLSQSEGNDIPDGVRRFRELRKRTSQSPMTEEEVEMRDEDDRIFFDVAKCANARLVTRNYKDYPVHELVTLIDEIY